ncbi:MAG: beta-ketoacyl synthase, partial [Pseudohongiellaceae bacterium]
NLRQAVRDIQSGTHRVAIVGTSEAPLVPEIFDGFATMGALADDVALRQLDHLSPTATPDHRRACRPFGHNAGFTLAESAQFVVLFDDHLALELGATVYAAVNEVFVNADGYKKSITGPGLGNYISMAKATAATRNIIGDNGLKNRSYVQAHGTGTPQNRTTESHILSQIAATFGIEKWPVTALKSYLGHSLASAAGDQLNACLGIWRYGIIPGIQTTKAIADDVSTDRLNILLQHHDVGVGNMDAVLVNSKGFGGNNATASILAPHIAEKMLARKHGRQTLNSYFKKNESVLERTARYDEQVNKGAVKPIYRYDYKVLERDALSITTERLAIAGHAREVNLQVPNSYTDMCE